MAFVTYDRFDQKANLKRDGFIVLSEFFANPSEENLKKATSFAIGSKDINTVIELASYDINLMKKEPFASVVQGCLNSSEREQTPEYHHLKALVAYSKENDAFQEKNNMTMLEAYKSRNHYRKKADWEKRYVADLRMVRGEGAAYARMQHEKDAAAYMNLASQYHKMVEGSEVGYLFNIAMNEYNIRANNEPNPSVAVIDRARAFAINDELLLDSYAHQKFSHKGLAIQNFLYPDAVLGFYNAKVYPDKASDSFVVNQNKMADNAEKHAKEFDWYGECALKEGGTALFYAEKGFSSSECD